MSEPILTVTNLRVAYGRVEAVKGISLRVDRGEIVAMVGSNGAGKTTTLRAISGLLRPRSGDIWFAGHELNKLKAHQVMRLGISHVPEGRRLFNEMTVIENLRMGVYARSAKPDFGTALQRVFARFPRLNERQAQIAGTLSGGEQQMLSIARALMSGPTFLMLDEPSFGLAPRIVQEIGEVILEICRTDGVSLLVVEQNAALAFRISQRTYVMENGSIVLDGESQVIAASPKVKEAYLGLGA